MNDISVQRLVEEQWERMAVSERQKFLEELSAVHLGEQRTWGGLSLEVLAGMSSASDLPPDLRWRLFPSFRGMDLASAACRSADLILGAQERDVPFQVWTRLRFRAIFTTIAERSDVPFPGNRTPGDLLDGELEEMAEELLSDGDFWTRLPVNLWPKRAEQAEYRKLLKRMRELPYFAVTRSEARIATERFNDGISKYDFRHCLRRLVEGIAV